MDRDIRVIRKNIKTNLAMLRVANKMKMREVAAALNIKENTYRTWEDSDAVSLPKANSLIALSELYNVSVDFLMKNQRDNLADLKTIHNAVAERVYGDKYLNELTSQEKRIILKYRMLNSKDREEFEKKLDEFLDINLM